jgi:hypothetical protein
MVSFHDSSVIIADSAFDESTGESALSLKNVYTDVQRVHFTNNQGVGLVIDRSPVGTVKDAAFIGNINGGLTLTQSQVSVIDTSVDGGVHCMKIARKSVPQILESTVRNCDNGIIVQDDAHATVEGGIFEGNTRAIEAHKENEYFAAPSITVTDSTFLENGEQYSVDGGAVVSIE